MESTTHTKSAVQANKRSIKIMNFFIFLLHRAALIHVPSGTRKKANREKEKKEKELRDRTAQTSQKISARENRENIILRALSSVHIMRWGSRFHLDHRLQHSILQFIFCVPLSRAIDRAWAMQYFLLLMSKSMGSIHGAGYQCSRYT